uniref:ATP-dependent DNA helicase n=1 Tax=Parastrongyloides trichosuri TaxID=131310 RepID=A0A0N4ZGE4_PARTI
MVEKGIDNMKFVYSEFSSLPDINSFETSLDESSATDSSQFEIVKDKNRCENNKKRSITKKTTSILKNVFNIGKSRNQQNIIDSNLVENISEHPGSDIISNESNINLAEPSDENVQPSFDINGFCDSMDRCVNINSNNKEVENVNVVEDVEQEDEPVINNRYNLRRRNVVNYQISDESESNHNPIINDPQYIPTYYERNLLNLEPTPNEEDNEDVYMRIEYDNETVPIRLQKRPRELVGKKLININQPSTYKNLGLRKKMKLRPFDFGNIVDGGKCQYCGAYNYFGEKIGKKCCKEGKYNDSIKMTRNYPDNLKNYFIPGNESSTVFLNNIRAINYEVSFGQFNCSARRLGGVFSKGIQPVVLQGNSYSRLNIDVNNFLNINAAKIKNGQYFMCGAEEFEAMNMAQSERNAPFVNARRIENNINELASLKYIFREYICRQSLAKKFKSFVDFIKENRNNEEYRTKNFQLRVVRPGAADQRNEEVPVNPEDVIDVSEGVPTLRQDNININENI